MPTHTKTNAIDPTVVQTVTWTGGIQHVIQHDGSLLIQGPCTVTGYTPSWDPVNKFHGACKYVHGGLEKHEFDIDGRLSATPVTGWHARMDVPINMMPGDVLIIGRSHAAFSGSYPSSYFPPGSSAASAFDDMLVVSCVAYDITPANVGELFRPPGLGISILSFALRGLQTPVSLMDMSLLPSVIDLAAVGTASGISMPNISFYEQRFAGFAGEIVDGWWSHSATPHLTCPGYGTAYAGILSQALMYLCSTNYTTAQKVPLAKSIVQRGLDLIGAYVDGRVLYPLGGQCHGRKTMMVLAGFLLHCHPFMRVKDFFPVPVTAEDGAWFKAPNGGSAWWFGGWPYGWRWQNPSGIGWPSGGPYDGSQLALTPSVPNWGSPSLGYVGSFAEAFKGYFWHVTGAHVGIALAAKLMGIRDHIGDELVGMIEQWMAGPGAGPEATLAAFFGQPTHWGESYAVDRQRMCDAAWTLYNP